MLRPVPLDPELAAVLEHITPPVPHAFSRERLPYTREIMAAQHASARHVVGDAPVDVREQRIAGPPGAPDLSITVLKPRTLRGPAPGIFGIHGGGMMVGHRNMMVPRLLALVLAHGVVAVNVDYRLAPDHAHPHPSDDCYAGLLWTVAHARELSLDPERLVVMGVSAGGGLAAAISLMARDRCGPMLAGQLLLCPMLDDSNTTISSHQYRGIGTWTRELNIAGWSALLGETVDGKAVSPYAAPARAESLRGLPPAYIEVGSAEPFRDENAEYARRIWAVGGQAELHVWSGGFHGFDALAPGSQLARAAVAARNSWLRRVLQP